MVLAKIRFMWPVAILLGGEVCGDGPPRATPTPSPALSREPSPAPPATTVPPSPPGPDDRTRPIRSFAVYGLSRGKGVPPEAREAVRKVRELVEADRKRGLTLRVETTRIGLEGETRTCVEYKEPKDGTEAHRRARAIVEGVDLVNLVAEPCATPGPEPGKQK